MKRLLPFLCLPVWLASCENAQSTNEYRVEVSTNDYVFVAPNELPSGWITFVLNNTQAQHVHELSISRLPEGISYVEYREKFVGSWSTILKRMQEGAIDASGIDSLEAELLPDWADRVQYFTSRGLVSPGHIDEKTVYLEPGKYILECWVKTADGVIHLNKGMTLPVTVTDQSAGSSEPHPPEQITLTADSIETDWQPSRGTHSFALHLMAGDDGIPVHNNINLIRLDNRTDLEAVTRWLDWYHVGGLRSPAPAEFLGGLSTYHSKVGQEAEYFTVTIQEPGEYAWLVEVPEGQRLWRRFVVR